MEEQIRPTDPAWSGWQKNTFRFFFLFLSACSLCGYNAILTITSLQYAFDLEVKMLSLFSKPIYWLDKHFYHFGYDPKAHQTTMGDGPFGWAMVLSIFWLSIAGTILWAWLDRRRKNYNRLHFWFRTYLAYFLFLAMIVYAVEKLIPSQMPYPNVDELLKPLGNQNRFELVWNYIGSSVPYGIFTGACELLAALMVLFRRTRVFGSLLMTAVLVNVVCLNVFYNIVVKLLSLNLLVTSLFLLVPYLPALYRFFYKLQPVSLSEKVYRFTTPWKKWTFVLLLLAPAWVSFGIIRKSMDMNQRDRLSRKNEKLYEVNRFISDSISTTPLITDTLRWKRFAVTAYRQNKMAIIYNMQEQGDYYDYDWDSLKYTLTLHDNPDSSTWHVFQFKYPSPGHLNLTGKWKGHRIQVDMNAVSIDSLFYLNQEKIKWVQDY